MYGQYVTVYMVQGFEFLVSDFGYMDERLGAKGKSEAPPRPFRSLGLGLGLGFGVEGSRFRVQG